MATVKLTAPESQSQTGYSSVNHLNMNGGLLDLQSTGIYVPTTSAGTAAIDAVLQYQRKRRLCRFQRHHQQYRGGRPPNHLWHRLLFQQRVHPDSTRADWRCLLAGIGKLYRSPLVSGPGALGPTTGGWAAGDFFYAGVVTTNDRTDLIKNEKATTVFPQLASLNDGNGHVGTAQVEYNFETGVLSLVITGSPDVDSVNVNLPGADASQQVNKLGPAKDGTGWQTVPSTATLLQQDEWAKINSGDMTASLPAGTYELAQLSTGLTASAFGLPGYVEGFAGGANNTLGAVWFNDSQGNSTADTVAIVPEPGTLALLAAAGLLGLGACAVRRRRKQGANPQGDSLQG